jgi:hypothetical protein
MLDIPTYLVWDSDSGLPAKDSHPKTNRILLRLAGEPEEDYPKKIGTTFACFEKKLEATLEAELGAEIIAAAQMEIIDKNPGAKTEDCLKRPSLFRDLLSKAAEKGQKCQSLDLLLDHVLELYAKSKSKLDQPTS